MCPVSGNTTKNQTGSSTSQMDPQQAGEIITGNNGYFCFCKTVNCGHS